MTKSMDEIRREANVRVDEIVKVGRDNGQSEFSIKLVDKVFRPFTIALDEERHGNQGDNAEQGKRDICMLLANMASDLLMAIAADASDPAYVTHQFESIATMFVDDFNAIVVANYTGWEGGRVN